MDTILTLDAALTDLSTAEDFLDYFGVTYDPTVVQVNRLHILQRFHDYLATHVPPETDEVGRAALYRRWLAQAYQDFVVSTPLKQRVFRVLQTVPHPEGGHTAYVSLNRLLRAGT